MPTPAERRRYAILARKGRPYDRARATVLARSRTCWLQLAGCTGWADTVDHVIPLSKGGSKDISNMRPACQHCNSSRGNKTIYGGSPIPQSRHW